MSEANICRSGNVLHFKKRRLPGSNNNDSYLVHLHQSLWGNKKASEMLAIWWCRRWDLNPHGFPHDFESCASAVPPLRHKEVLYEVVWTAHDSFWNKELPFKPLRYNEVLYEVVWTAHDSFWNKELPFKPFRHNEVKFFKIWLFLESI